MTHSKPAPLQSISLGRYLSQNSAIIVGTMLFIWAWLLVYGLVIYQPTYTSEALVLIKDSAVTQDYVTAGGYQSTTSSNSSNPVLNTMGLLKSSEISEALYQHFMEKNPDVLAQLEIEDATDWKAFFNDGKKFIKAKNKAGTDYITVHFTWTDPEVSKDALTQVLTAFQNSSLNINKSEYENRSKYLTSQVEEITSELEKVRKVKSEFKTTNKTVNTQREGETLTHLRSEFQTRLNDVMSQAEGKHAEMERLQKSLGMTPEEGLAASALGMNATMAQLKDKLYGLSQEYAYLSATLTQKNPKVKEVKAKMDQVEKDIQDEMLRTLGTTSDINATLSVSDSTRAQLVNQLVSTQAEFIRLASQTEALKSRLDEIELKVQSFPSVEEGLVVIEEKEQSLSESLATLRQKLLESKLKKAQTLSNVFIVDAPHVQATSDFPTPIHLVLLSVAIGLAAGVSMALMKYQWMDNPKGLVIDHHLLNAILGIELEQSNAQSISRKYNPPGLDERYLDQLLNNFENKPDLVEHLLEDQEKHHYGLSQNKIALQQPKVKALKPAIQFNPTPFSQVMPPVTLPSPISVSEPTVASISKSNYQIRDYQAGAYKAENLKNSVSQKDLLSELNSVKPDDVTRQDIKDLKEKLVADNNPRKEVASKEPPAFMNNTVSGPWGKLSPPKSPKTSLDVAKVK